MNRKKKLKLLRDELAKFSEDFDTTDPEWSQVLFKKHVSRLIDKGVIRTNKLPRKVRMMDILESLLDEAQTAEIWEQARQLDDVLHSYGDEPDKEAMEEARDSLESIVGVLNDLLNGDLQAREHA